MFFGTGTTSSVIQFAGWPGADASAAPNALVVLVNTKAATPAATDSSSSASVPLTFVSTNCCAECVTMCGLCSVAAWITARTPRSASRSSSRSVTLPTWSVYGEGLHVHAHGGPPLGAKRADQRLAEVPGAAGDQDAHALS
jgi:hypothetical protein